jgi:hypothetical protein
MRAHITINALAVGLLVSCISAPCQLAITEVMSQASPTFNGPDYWEVTNFGTNRISLHRYRFYDRGGNGTNIYDLSIGGKESVIFVRSKTETNRDLFIQWWGQSKLPTNLQVYFVVEPGINASIGDDLNLADPSGRAVDRVTVGKAQEGFSFTYDTNTGAFSEISSAANGAWTTASGDVGSPGFTTGDIPLRITRQPLDQSVNGCARTVLDVEFVGMPRPKFQWLTNGAAVPNGSENPLSFDVIAPAAFTAQVRLSNGVHDDAVSANAVVTVTDDPVAPIVRAAPMDTRAFTRQRVRFSGRIEGYPCVQHQWSRDGIELIDETNECLEVYADCLPGTQTFTLRASNNRGSTNLTATLTVSPWPQLKISEVMADPRFVAGEDWFELTNCGTNSFDLQGCTFSDSTNLTSGFTIRDALSIAPDESVIFVENMDAQQFKNWWGSGNLPPCVQIITFGGFGIDRSHDEIYFWNSATIDPADIFATASFNSSAYGATLLITNNECGTGCSEEELRGCFGAGGVQSGLDFPGAFPAALSEDVGSPGYSAEVQPGTWHCPPILLSIQRNGSILSIVCSSMLGRQYQLESRESLSSGGWSPSPGQLLVASGPTITFVEPYLPTSSMRFFRVLEF